MAYNPIAPTSSRENRKPPTNIPAGAVLVADPNGGWMWSTETAAADAQLVVDEDGGFAADTEATSGARLVVVARDVLAIGV